MPPLQPETLSTVQKQFELLKNYITTKITLQYDLNFEFHMKINIYHHGLYQCEWAETSLISVYCLTYLSDQPQLKQIIRFYTKEYITKPPSMFVVRFQQFCDITLV